MFDLLIKNANLPDGRTGIDIAVSGGKIAAVEAGIAAEAGEVIDATGRLVSLRISIWMRRCRSGCRA